MDGPPDPKSTNISSTSQSHLLCNSSCIQLFCNVVCVEGSYRDQCYLAVRAEESIRGNLASPKIRCNAEVNRQLSHRPHHRYRRTRNLLKKIRKTGAAQHLRQRFHAWRCGKGLASTGVSTLCWNLAESSLQTKEVSAAFLPSMRTIRSPLIRLKWTGIVDAWITCHPLGSWVTAILSTATMGSDCE